MTISPFLFSDYRALVIPASAPEGTMMTAPTTSYLPAMTAPNDGEKYRLLNHHARYGVCAASLYCAARRAGYRIAEHPQPLRDMQVKKAQPVFFFRRMTFVRFLLGRLSAC